MVKHEGVGFSGESFFWLVRSRGVVALMYSLKKRKLRVGMGEASPLVVRRN